MRLPQRIIGLASVLLFMPSATHADAITLVPRYVTFKPLSTGSRPGTMSISTNGGGSPRSVALGGTGVGGVGVALGPRVAAITDTEVQQLTATVTNATNTTVTWLVDGVQDGNSTVGTITVTGLNTA